MKGRMALLIACILISVLVIGCAPKPAEFIISNLTITPNEVNTGASATIEVTATNIGESSGTYEVALKIDDTIETTEKVTLDGGASQKATFATSKTVAKTYSVSIGNLSDTFEVKSKPTPPPVVSPPPPPPPPTFSGWGPLLWGPEFQVTPGIVSSSQSGVPSKAQDGSTIINYWVLTTLPMDDQLYYLWTKKADSPPQLLGTYRLGQTQYAITSGGQLVPVTFTETIGLGRFAKGEAFEFVLANADKTRVVFWKNIPVPIEVRQGSYRLWVELKSSDGKVFVAWGEGFDPNEEVDIVSTSDSEILSSKGKADADGRVMVALLPIGDRQNFWFGQHYVTGKVW